MCFDVGCIRNCCGFVVQTKLFCFTEESKLLKFYYTDEVEALWYKWNCCSFTKQPKVEVYSENALFIKESSIRR